MAGSNIDCEYKRCFTLLQIEDTKLRNYMCCIIFKGTFHINTTNYIESQRWVAGVVSSAHIYFPILTLTYCLTLLLFYTLTSTMQFVYLTHTQTRTCIHILPSIFMMTNNKSYKSLHINFNIIKFNTNKQIKWWHWGWKSKYPNGGWRRKLFRN